MSKPLRMSDDDLCRLFHGENLTTPRGKTKPTHCAVENIPGLAEYRRQVKDTHTVYIRVYPVTRSQFHDICRSRSFIHRKILDQSASIIDTTTNPDDPEEIFYIYYVG